MREEMEKNRASLVEAQLTIDRLKQQLTQLQAAKEELEVQQNELREMMQRLEQNINMEAEEKQKLAEEIRSKQLEVQRIQQEVDEKDAETQRLQEEIERARLREEQLAESARLAAERKQREAEELSNNERELESLPDGADTALPELSLVNEQLLEQLKVCVVVRLLVIDDDLFRLYFQLLQNKLDETRKQDQDTDLDKIHRVNLRDGRDKYKTLADIRRGNTIRRVEMFENM